MPRLLEGEPARSALDAALARVAGLVPHLTADTGPRPPVPDGGPDRPVPADGDWTACSDLIDDPPWLGRVIRSTGRGIGTDDPVVAASIFVQGYSYRVLTLTVACLTASGVVPDASAPATVVALARHWPSRLRFTGTRVTVLDSDPATTPTDSPALTEALRLVVHQCVELHLAPLVDSVRAGIGVAIGERLLWGNIAASAATAFRTMEGCLGPFVEPLGERFFALAPPTLQGLGSFLVIDTGRRRGWFWERTNCCLFDRLPGAVRCADCSRTPSAVRRAAYREFLDQP